jgi:predicted nucleic acid-binding protein
MARSWIVLFTSSSVARQQKLTEYVAAYVGLALRNGLPLSTLDDQLRQAVRKSGIALVYV